MNINKILQSQVHILISAQRLDVAKMLLSPEIDNVPKFYGDAVTTCCVIVTPCFCINSATCLSKAQNIRKVSTGNVNCRAEKSRISSRKKKNRISQNFYIIYFQ